MILINDALLSTAYKKKVDLGFSNRKYGGSRCISIIGVLVNEETVAFEIPKVLDPDESVDAHWTPLIQFSPLSGVDEQLVFVAGGENAKLIPADLTVRIVKSITSSNIGVALL